MTHNAKQKYCARQIDFGWESCIHPREISVCFLLLGFWTGLHEAKQCEDTLEGREEESWHLNYGSKRLHISM